MWDIEHEVQSTEHVTWNVCISANKSRIVWYIQQEIPKTTQDRYLQATSSLFLIRFPLRVSRSVLLSAFVTRSEPLARPKRPRSNNSLRLVAYATSASRKLEYRVDLAVYQANERISNTLARSFLISRVHTRAHTHTEERQTSGGIANLAAIEVKSDFPRRRRVIAATFLEAGRARASELNSSRQATRIFISSPSFFSSQICFPRNPRNSGNSGKRTRQFVTFTWLRVIQFFSIWTLDSFQLFEGIFRKKFVRFLRSPDGSQIQDFRANLIARHVRTGEFAMPRISRAMEICAISGERWRKTRI